MHSLVSTRFITGPRTSKHAQYFNKVEALESPTQNLSMKQVPPLKLQFATPWPSHALQGSMPSGSPHQPLQNDL